MTITHVLVESCGTALNVLQAVALALGLESIDKALEMVERYFAGLQEVATPP